MKRTGDDEPVRYRITILQYQFGEYLTRKCIKNLKVNPKSNIRINSEELDQITTTNNIGMPYSFRCRQLLCSYFMII